MLRPLGHDETAVETWYNHWIAEGFGALEQLLSGDGLTGKFCHGDTPGLADVVLVPKDTEPPAAMVMSEAGDEITPFGADVAYGDS